MTKGKPIDVKNQDARRVFTAVVVGAETLGDSLRHSGYEVPVHGGASYRYSGQLKAGACLYPFEIYREDGRGSDGGESIKIGNTIFSVIDLCLPDYVHVNAQPVNGKGWRETGKYVGAVLRVTRKGPRRILIESGIDPASLNAAAEEALLLVSSAEELYTGKKWLGSP